MLILKSDEHDVFFRVRKFNTVFTSNFVLRNYFECFFIDTYFKVNG